MMSGFTGSVEENPPGGTPFNRGFKGACPSCGDPVTYEILLDLYNTPCRSCGTYAILYFWGKEEGPHMTEDLAYMFCEEGLMTEEHLENALETKHQSEPTPLIELLLSIQYVTVSELEDLARELIPDEWTRYLSGEQYRQSADDYPSDTQKLARPEVDALYSLLDQIYSGCGYPFSRMSSDQLERLIRGLGGDLTAGDIRNRFGALLISKEVLSGPVTERSFARLFSRTFTLDFEGETARAALDSLDQETVRRMADQCVFPLEKKEDMVRVGIPGHLVALGFHSFFDLPQPAEVRESLDIPMEFSVMSVSRIEQSFESVYELGVDVDPKSMEELLGTALDELSGEIVSRYEALDDHDQPVAPGQESERPAAALRAIFESTHLVSAPHSDRKTADETGLFPVWLYHPEADEQIPEVVDRGALDELDNWAGNRFSDQEIQRMDGPDRERDDVERLSRAFKQLRNTGEVYPEKLNLPVEILDGVTEVEAGLYDAIPVARAGEFLWFGVADPSSQIVDELSAFTGEEVRAIPANPESVEEVLVRFYGVRKGDWVLEHSEEDLQEQEAFDEFVEFHGVSDNRSKLSRVFPEFIAEELDVVPLEITPEDFILASRQRPDFLDRQLLQVLFRRSVSYRFVSKEMFQKLFQTVYETPENNEEEAAETGRNRNRWEHEKLEDLIGAPLSLGEIQTTQNLLKKLENNKKNAPKVRVVTDHDTARSYPPVYQDEGRLKVRANALEELPDECWTPAMETFFPVLPMQEMSSDFLFASASLDRRWFLELLGLFTDRESHVVILPNRTIEELSIRRKGNPDTDIADESEKKGEQDMLSASRYMEYRPSHLFESFHELAEENQLKKFILLLLVYLFEHRQESLRIVTEGDRCVIQSYRADEDRSELFSIDNAHIYGLRYAFQEMAGKSLTDFNSEQEASFDFIYGGDPRQVSFAVQAKPNGQELHVHSKMK